MRSSSLPWIWCVAMVGCSSSGSTTTTTVGPPRASDYSALCTVDTDCALIDTSSDACCGGCASDAIAKSDYERYQVDRNRFRSTCSTTTPCPGRRCELWIATCEGGKCKASACSPACPGADAGTDAGADAGKDAAIDVVGE